MTPIDPLTLALKHGMWLRPNEVFYSPGPSGPFTSRGITSITIHDLMFFDVEGEAF